MDYKKIGLFLAQERKAKKLTQAQVAEKLYVSEKTISKWENGRGLPDTSLLINLCALYDLSINELLSGERLNEQNYKTKAEDTMETLLSQRKSNKQKMFISILICVCTLSILFVCVALASFLNIPIWLRICLIIYGFIVAVCGVGICIFFDINVGSFECKHCGKKFVPTTKAYIFSYHNFTARKLKCPFCGKTSMCKKRLQNKD